jgi:Glycosyl transferase 4-like domain
MERPPVCFIAWSAAGGRASEIAAALGGEGRCFYHRCLVRRSLVPIRYAVSAVQTVAYLVRRRPAAVIATNPPIFPGLLAYAYGRTAGVPVLLDSHPSSFGRKENRMARLLLPLHAWLAARAASTMVTTDALAEQVATWGGDADIVHEAPPVWPPMPQRVLPDLPTVLFVGGF